MPRATSRVRAILMPLSLVVAAVVSTLASGPAAAAPNPPWRASCPLRLVLVVDQSESMWPRFDAVRTASSNVVDALRDKSSTVAVVGFGSNASIAVEPTDVSDQSARASVKERVSALVPYSGYDGGTNWTAGLTAVLPFKADVAILVTDGMPNEVETAVVVSDQLKAAGTRVVAVGIDIDQSAATNLAAVTGPTLGQDYFAGDTSSLLRTLYTVVANSCGVAITDLPQPEGPPSQLPEILTIALPALLLAALIGYLLYRKRAPRRVRTARRVEPGERVSAVSHQEVKARLRDGSAPGRGPGGRDGA
ncbi:vWA domain-containing protein [Actinokineospora cianjurensis]|uniref:von Willebrand factor type A domain-containing protein n=1 Tax=Actinokineospora cianjurensis TaxID=585224 RepID=A0A421AVV5_9PSEU|nr:vWA domain-containing protein [Actinokineospora cianjurensis]RLK54191.1 von Willebrand factor type A domain-containing protein [Actinokineospora cianjurensis]